MKFGESEVMDAIRRADAGERNYKVNSLFVELHALQPGSDQHNKIRDLLIEANLPLVRMIGMRFRGRGDIEDLLQVGAVGLIKAVDRYDPIRGTPFGAFAILYIRGEMLRYLRDATWIVSVPRRLKDIKVEVRRATEKLQVETGTAPKVCDVAKYLGLEEKLVRESISAAASANPEALVENSRDSLKFDRVADLNLQRAEDRQYLTPLISNLKQTDREILRLRFVLDLTQSKIGAMLGISQMQVSRRLKYITGLLREGLTSEDSDNGTSRYEKA
ncbi:sigma-70 family RNA polymerase sigma factor [Streptomyces sp. NPDC090112]|uniref:sigma-70 family RNA polymerase sigma factor n=1 Tax=Streptomyces sp. NPDC090112 TaxID=3365949 RepID=UPI00380F7EE1